MVDKQLPKMTIFSIFVSVLFLTTSSMSISAQDSIEALPIVDTHIHIWQLPRSAAPMSDSGTFPPDGIPWLTQDFLMDDYTDTMGGAMVGHVVLVESSNDVSMNDIIQSNQWMLDQVEAHDILLSLVGSLDITQEPEAFIEQLDMLDVPNFVGIRIKFEIFEPDVEQTFENLKPHVIENLTELASRGMMIDTFRIPVETVGEIAKAVPDLNIVMDHWAGKPQTLEAEGEWVASLQAVATQSNVYVKVSDTHRLSTAEMEGAWPEQFTAIDDPNAYTDVLDILLETLGEDQLIFGTNWPVSEVGGAESDTIELQINILEAYFENMDIEIRNKIMNENAMRVYSPRE